MNPAKLPLVLAATVFITWISYLAYLTLTTTNPTVLSRPQFLVSTLDVIAQVDEQNDGKPEPRVTVLEVQWPEGEKERLVGEKIEVVNLELLTNKEGWKGANRYILPLIELGGNEYVVASLPPSPGFTPALPDKDRPAGSARIYLVNDETRKQLQQIRKPQAVPLPGD